MPQRPDMFITLFSYTEELTPNETPNEGVRKNAQRNQRRLLRWCKEQKKATAYIHPSHIVQVVRIESALR